MASTSEIEQGYEDDRFENAVSQSFHCPICLNVLKEPVMCRSNQHYFCKSCITRHLENSSTCPSCMDELTVETLRKAPRIVTEYLSELNICCDYLPRGCHEVMLLNDLKRHVNICGFSPVKCSNDGCNMTVNKRDKVHHETELCDFRKVKCHDCVELKKEVAEMKDQFAAQMYRMEENITTQASHWREERISAQASQMDQIKAEIMKGVTSVLTEIKTLKEEMKSAEETDIVQGQELDAHSRADIIIAGGETVHDSYKDSVEVFSWSTKSWARLDAMQQARSEACAVMYESQMIVTGGFNDDGDGDTMEKMDVKLDEPGNWKYFPAKLPNQCYAHRCVCYKDRLIVIGGRDCNNARQSDDIHEVLLVPPYCTKLLARLPQARLRHGVEFLFNKIFIFGGVNENDELDSVVMFDVSEKKCQQMAPLPFAVSCMATVIWGNSVIVIGGKNSDGEVLDSVVMYDVTTGESKILPPMNHKRWACTAVITGDVVVVMGGYDEEAECLGSVECFNLGRQVWEELSHMIEPRAYATAVVKK